MLSTDAAFQQLNQLCEGELAGVLEDQHFINGLIFAVSAAPEIPMPEEWLVWTFKARGQLASTEQADTLTDVLMTLLQNQLRAMRDEQVQLPRNYTFDEDPNAPASKWLTGLLSGHTRLESVWHTAWEQKVAREPSTFSSLKRDLSHCLKMFSTFADVPLAKRQAVRAGNDALIEKLPIIFPSLTQALQKYVAISGELVAFLPDQFESYTESNS